MIRADVRQSVGEVVRATTTQFTAQCPRGRLHNPPAFGSLVRVVPFGAQGRMPEPETPVVVDPFADPEPPSNSLPGTPDETLFAIVTWAGTGSAEPGRRLSAYGLEEDRLHLEQPQIFELLATEFAALAIGWSADGRFRSGIPPRPPRLHASVTECSAAEICSIADSPDLLRTIAAARTEAPVDELLIAAIGQAYTCRGSDYAFLVRAGKQLAILLRDSPDRLAAILERLEP